MITNSRKSILIAIIRESILIAIKSNNKEAKLRGKCNNYEAKLRGKCNNKEAKLRGKCNNYEAKLRGKYSNCRKSLPGFSNRRNLRHRYSSGSSLSSANLAWTWFKDSATAGTPRRANDNRSNF